MIFESLFTEPRVKSVDIYDTHLSLDIYLKNKKCGNVSITSSDIVYSISYRLKVRKGMLAISNVELKYSKGKLSIVNSNNDDQIMLQIKCKEDIYQKVLFYFYEAKNSSSDISQKKRKEDFFGKID